MKKSFTKIVSVVIAVMLAVTAMACFASAAPVVEGCDCNCCESANSANCPNNGSQGDRDIYLVLDISGSMSGTPIKKLKEAAKEFCAAMLNDKTGNNRIVIVTYATTATNYSFSTDYDELAATIDSLTAKGSTAMYDALMSVKTINEKYGNEDASKHVVVMADGLPNEGATLSSGKYTSKDSNMYYKYGNAVYSTAAGMWYDYNIYSIGFFHNLGGSQLEFGKVLMEDIQNALHLEVYDPDELLAAFTGVADCILGECICDEDCDCGLYGCCECCKGDEPPCENANDDGSCNCSDICTCGDDCDCGENCTCCKKNIPCDNANDDGSCNCSETCTCGDNCNCGANCPCCMTTTETTTVPTTAPTTAEPTTDSIPQTGDSAVGIAAAAVIMLAGIAVVATKKRED